jgi:preprotein translocase subunit SecB
MQPSPLQLLQCCFESVNVVAVPDFDNSQRDPSFVFNPTGMEMSSETAVQDLGGDKEWCDYAIRLVVGFEPKQPNATPYRGQLALQGVVRMHGAKTLLDRKQLAVVNGVSLMYGVARDMVCTLTSRGVHGQMLLPTLNFRSLAESVALDDAQAPPTAEAQEAPKHATKPRKKTKA